MDSNEKVHRRACGTDMVRPVSHLLQHGERLDRDRSGTASDDRAPVVVLPSPQFQPTKTMDSRTGASVVRYRSVGEGR